MRSAAETHDASVSDERTPSVYLCCESGDANLARAFLEEYPTPLEVHWCPTYDDAFGRPRTAGDVYIVDVDFDSGRGMQLAREVAPVTPTIILARHARDDIEGQALSMGVADVLLRPEITPSSLTRAVRLARLRGTPSDHPAPSAEVTLPVLRRRVGQAIARAQRGLEGMALLLVVATTKAGAKNVSAALTTRVEACIAETDTLCPTSSGVWVLVEGADALLLGARTASRVLAEVSAPIAIAREQVEVDARVAIAAFPEDGENVDALILSARRAVETPSRDGPRSARFPSAPSARLVSRRLEIEHALTTALRDDEFELFYQPQINLETGQPVGAEALLRWKSGRMGPISPAEFIPVLEDTGGITEVGGWVMSKACQQAAAWAAAGLRIKTSVNVSAAQFKMSDVGALVVRALEDSQLDPSLLTLELTEGVMLEATDAVLATLNALRKSGVKVAIDDFGTGYASLRYVKDFPMDVLKIDREFVRGLPLSQENAAITNSIVALGRSLALSVVAEGVETEAEAEFLRSLQCDTSQGFLHAKPMPADAATEWLGKQ